MRKLIPIATLAALALAGSVAAAAAQEAMAQPSLRPGKAVPNGSAIETVFIGGMSVTAVTSACQQFSKGWYGNMLYHPYIPGNHTWSGLNLLWPWASSGYSADKTAFGSSFVSVYATGVSWGSYGWTGAKVRIVKQSPTTITSTTPHVDITFQIAYPEWDTGGAACIATIDAALVKNPNP